MSKIPLRSYHEEIQSLTEQGKIDEAILHCQHILKYYPKHVDTYRMLGQAYLENQRLGDAADIFQRVLSAVPEDFVSHIGMSIIREDEGNLNAAIWHMQRAFDVQSSNITIQDELRRLYGKRDGIEPPKIRLTRAALAHMYAQGDLIDEAIAELRTSLKEEPERIDMLVLLARMYHRNSQRVKAVQICSQVLNKLPYCLEANHIIGQVLKETNRESEAATHLKRARELDPHLAYVSPQYPSVDRVPDAAVNVNRLGASEIRELLQSGMDQPSWAAALGVNVRAEAEEEEQDIDWLLSGGSPESPEDEAKEEQSAPPFVFAEMEEEIEDSKAEEPSQMGDELDEPSDPIMDSIPDWMKEAGWGPKSERPARFADQEDVGVEPLSLEEESGSQEIQPAEIPDWLKSMAPENLSEDTAPLEAIGESSEPLSGQEAAPGWMSDLDQEAEDSMSVAPGELPEWLKNMDPEGAAIDLGADTGIFDSSADVPAEAAPADSLPEWLLDSGTEEELEQEAIQNENLPDWLEDLAEPVEESELVETGDAEPEGDPILETLAAESDQEAGPEEDIDWLVAPESQDSDVEAEPAEAPDGLDWLTELAKDQTETEDLEEEDWILEESDEPFDVAEEESEGDAADLPSEWLAEEPVATSMEEEPKVPTAAEDLQGWVEELAEDLEAGKRESTGVTDWLEDKRAEVENAAEALGAELEAEDEVTEPQPEEGLPVWLQALDTELVSGEIEESPQSQEVEIPRATEEDSPVPDWLHNLDDEISAGFETSAGTIEEPDEPQSEVIMEEENDLPELPDMDDSDAALRWLENLAANQGAKEEELLTSPEERSDAPPDWIQDMVKSEAEAGDQTEVDLGGETVLEFESPAETDPAPEDAFEAPEDMEEIAESEPVASTEMDEPEPVAQDEPDGGTWVQGDPLPEWLTEDESETVMEQAGDSELDSMDPDQALAWLEGLAAKQGVEEEELLTAPEDRPEDVPDWLAQAEAEAEVTEDSTAETVIAEVDEAPEMSADVVDTPEEEVKAVEEEGWIDSLVEDQPVAAAEEEPDGEDLPEWLMEDLDEDAVEEPPELPEWLQGVEVEEEPTGAEPEEAAEGVASESDVPDWLRKTVISDSPFAKSEETEAATQAAGQEEWGAGEMEPPEDTEEEAEYAWMAPETEAEPEVEEAAPEEVEAEMDQEAEAEMSAEAMPAGLDFDEAEPETEMDAPDEAILEEEPEAEAGDEFEVEEAMPETAMEGPEATAEVVEPLESAEDSMEHVEADEEMEAAPAEEPASELEWPEVEVSEPAEPEPAMSLEGARDAMSGGSLANALSAYGNLIAREESLDAVISDLRSAVEYDHPVDIDVWQTLGDAYARNNQLQDALDAYTQAEELLR